MTYFMGVDGGGSNLRIAIVDDSMNMIAQATASTANPSIIGREASAALIQATMRETLSQIQLKINGVGIGIAGASADYAADWLREVVASLLPDVFIVPSGDNEIALVGAQGERRGILILAGTGSIAYGVNDAGEAVRVGGWGYLMDDEGSGYRISMDALQAVMFAYDGRGGSTLLTDKIRTELKFSENVFDLISWLYSQPRNREVAQLASVVFDAAQEGDVVAAAIVERAAQELLRMVQTVKKRLNMIDPPIALAGGLLQNPNILSMRLCELLGLESIPVLKYPPVVGAALLAQLRMKEQFHAD